MFFYLYRCTHSVFVYVVWYKYCTWNIIYEEFSSTLTQRNYRTYIKTIETTRTVSKQTETTLNFHKNIKICSLSNCFGSSSVCFGSIKTSKLSVLVWKLNSRNKLFRKKPKQTKKTGKPQNFLKKYQNMLHIKLFRLVFCLFWFNRNIKHLCFRIEAGRNKRSDSAETSFCSSFGCFESKLVSKDTLVPLLLHTPPHPSRWHHRERRTGVWRGAAAQSRHWVAVATFWRTSHHDGKISPVRRGVHAHPVSLY